MRWSKRLPYALVATVVLCCLLSVRQPAAGQQNPLSGPLPVTPAPTQTTKRAAPEFFVMIDAGHGGDDRGAALSLRFSEKDVTLSLAKALKADLEDRGIPVRLLRESDVALSLDRRAEITNEQHAGIYIALHASASGSGVRVYTAMLSSPQPAAGRFLPWETAQTAFLGQSKAAAGIMANELKKKFQVETLSAPLRPMNNIVAPAIALELLLDPADLRGNASVDDNIPDSLAPAVTAALAQIRARMGGQP